MGLASILVALVAPIAIGVVAQNFYDRCPRLATSLRHRASSRMQPDQAERYAEEWAAHAQQLDGKLDRVLHAVGCLIASYRINPPPPMSDLRIMICFYSIEKWALIDMRRRSRRLETRTLELSAHGQENDAELRESLDACIDTVAKLMLIRTARLEIWKQVVGSADRADVGEE